MVPVEAALEMVVMAKCMSPVPRMTQHMARLFCQGTHRGPRRNVPAVRRLASNAAYGAPRDGGHSLQQVTRRRIAMQGLGDSTDTLRQVRRSLGDRARNLGKHFSSQRGRRSRDDGKQFAGGHSDQRKELLGRFVFCFRFRGELSEVLHHGVGIDLADGADLVLAFEFALVLEFLFAFPLSQKATGNVAKGAEPAFAFQAGLVFEFLFAFFFALTLTEKAACDIAQGAEPAFAFQAGFVF
jgi:hypothetical protein